MKMRLLSAMAVLCLLAAGCSSTPEASLAEMQARCDRLAPCAPCPPPGARGILDGLSDSAFKTACRAAFPCQPCPGNPQPPPIPPPVTPPPPPIETGDAIDLSKVNWVHGRGQDIASWPVTAKLASVEFRLPYVCSAGMDWPDAWAGYGAKNVTANHVVIANINGQLYGGSWEVMYKGVALCRVLEVLRDGTPDLGPFGQVEQWPFMDWYPAKGDKICFIVTSNIRAGVLQPVGRSNAVCATYP